MPCFPCKISGFSTVLALLEMGRRYQKTLGAAPAGEEDAAETAEQDTTGRPSPLAAGNFAARAEKDTEIRAGPILAQFPDNILTQFLCDLL